MEEIFCLLSLSFCQRLFFSNILKPFILESLFTFYFTLSKEVFPFFFFYIFYFLYFIYFFCISPKLTWNFLFIFSPPTPIPPSSLAFFLFWLSQKRLGFYYFCLERQQHKDYLIRSTATTTMLMVMTIMTVAVVWVREGDKGRGDRRRGSNSHLNFLIFFSFLRLTLKERGGRVERGRGEGRAKPKKKKNFKLNTSFILFFLYHF